MGRKRKYDSDDALDRMAEAQRKYRGKNLDKIRAYNKKRYRDKLGVHNKEYYENKDNVLSKPILSRYCYKCKTIKTIESYYYSNKKKGIRQRMCIACSKEYSAKYRENPEKKEYMRQYHKNNKHSKYDDYVKNKNEGRINFTNAKKERPLCTSKYIELTNEEVQIYDQLKEWRKYGF